MEQYELPGFELRFNHLFETDFHLPANADPAAVACLENVIAELDDEKILTTDRGYPYEELYKRLQYYDAGESPGFHGLNLEEELEPILKARSRQDWGYHLNGSWYHWFYAEFTKYTEPTTNKGWRDREYIDESQLIKVYLSTKSVRNKDLFIDLLCFLYDHCSKRFALKLAMQGRADNICIWITRDDFFLLEQYVKEREESFVRRLSFVPYRGLMGISRDMCDPGTYNQTMAEIIYHYLKTKNKDEKISLESMYRNFVRLNFTKNDDKLFGEFFHRVPLKAVMVILESLDLLAVNSDIRDDHPFLFSDRREWQLLNKYENWHVFAYAWSLPDKNKLYDSMGCFPYQGKDEVWKFIQRDLQKKE